MTHHTAWRARVELLRHAAGAERDVCGTVDRGAKKKTEDADESGGTKEDNMGAAAGALVKASPKKAAPKDEVTASKAKGTLKSAVPKDVVIEIKDNKEGNTQVNDGGVCARGRGWGRIGGIALEARVGGNENSAPGTSDRVHHAPFGAVWQPAALDASREHRCRVARRPQAQPLANLEKQETTLNVATRAQVRTFRRSWCAGAHRRSPVQLSRLLLVI